MILVDTSIWIDYFNGYRSLEAEFLVQLIESNPIITIPGIVLTEILLGLKSEAEATRVNDLLTVFTPTPECDHHDYQEAARIYRACRKQGITIRSTIDCLIAQLCLRHHYQLLAKDRDFNAIANYTSLELLKVGS